MIKKMLNILICVILISLYGCNSANQAEKVGEISINMKQPFAVVNNSINCTEGSSILVLQSLENMNLHFFEFDSNIIKTSYIVNSKVIRFLPFFQVFIKDLDSIVLFDPETNSVTIVDTSGLVLFEEKLEGGVPTLNPDNRLNSIGSKLFLGNSAKYLNISIPHERNEYYKTVKPIYQVDIQNDQVFEIIQWGSFPLKYVQYNYDYCNYFPNVCSYSSESVLVSFLSEDSIYLYKKEYKVRSILCASKFINKFMPYPEKKRLDMAFYKNYLIGEPKYTALIYNKYKQQYLRVAKHKFNYKSENKLDSEEMTWSIIVMNNKLKVIEEFVFDYRFNSPEIILCSIDGIYISNVPNSLENTNHLSLSLYKL